MTGTAAASDPIHAPWTRRGRLAAVLADLHQLGLPARLLSRDILGEDDVRLQVWAADRDVTIELLWCCPGEPAPARLEAVRVAADERTVWRHLHGRCVPAEITRFVCDLLLLDEGTLAERYRPLG